MKTKDITEKRLEEYADVFADIVNVLLFQGKQLVKPENLVDETPRGIYKADGKIYEQERDVAKYLVSKGVKIALLGLENQTAEDKYMVVRAIGYDGANYRKALKDRDDVARIKKKKRNVALPDIYPVITIVLYFGDKPWSGPRKLSECMAMPEEFNKYFFDYGINLFEIAFLDEKTVNLFKSDFKYVAQLFTQQRLKKDGEIKEITLTPFEIQHAAATLELLKTFTGDNRFEEAYNEIVKGGQVDMFTMFDAYEKQGKDKGLFALVASLSEFVPDVNDVYKRIIKNADYKNTKKAEVKRIWDEIQNKKTE